MPSCVNLWRGYYTSGVVAIGFGDDSTILEDNAEELTEIQFYDYVRSTGNDVTEAAEVYANLLKLSINKYQNKYVLTKEDVRKNAREKIDSLFSDPEKKLTTEQYKERLMAQVICILIADSGRIKYSETNIPGVIDKETSDAFIAALLPGWLAAEQVRIDSEQFIIDQNL